MEKIILISRDVPLSVEKILSKYGQIRKLAPHKDLQWQVASHGDMLCFLDKSRSMLFTDGEYLKKNYDTFKDIRVSVIDEKLGSRYPEDICLDALAIGDVIVCREANTAQKIKDGKRVINVKQGYAKCSVCLLDEESAITADKGIAQALSKLGVDVCLIREGAIVLEGYSYGFIGGASAVIDKRVIFFGDIKKHPDSDRILDFINNKGFDVEYPEDVDLTDLGSAIVIEKEIE